MSAKFIALSSAFAAVGYLVLGKITYKPLQGWLQSYQQSLPAAINGALFAGVGVSLAKLLINQRFPASAVAFAAGGAALVQIVLGGQVFNSIVDKMPQLYDYLAPLYTALGVVLGAVIFKMVM